MRIFRKTLLFTAGAFALATTTMVPGQSGSKHMEHGSATKEDPRAVIHASPQDIQPLLEGEKLPKPDKPLHNKDGEEVDLREKTKGETTILVFYRGGWCPFCSAHNAELASIVPMLKEHDVQMLNISPDSPETISNYQEEHDLPLTLLSDNNHETMKSFGIAFHVDDETVKRYKENGLDLVAASGNPDPVLPVPSVFVIDEKGTITYSHSNPDISQRLSREEVLTAAGITGDATGSGSKKEGSGMKEEGSGMKEEGSGSKDESSDSSSGGSGHK